jgi:N-acetyltransferase
MLDLGLIELRRGDLRLRAIEAADAPALAAAAAESREHYAFTPVPDGLSESEAAVERALRARADGLRYAFAIEWRGRVAGTTSYFNYEVWPKPAGCTAARSGNPDAIEIGHTWLGASAQHTACNTTAKFLLLEHAFERLAVHRVSIITDERNLRSRRAIERLGAVFEGIRRAHKWGTDCTVRNSAAYSIVASEWPAMRAHLLERLDRA